MFSHWYVAHGRLEALDEAGEAAGGAAEAVAAARDAALLVAVGAARLERGDAAGAVR